MFRELGQPIKGTPEKKRQAHIPSHARVSILKEKGGYGLPDLAPEIGHLEKEKENHSENWKLQLVVCAVEFLLFLPLCGPLALGLGV